MPPTCFRLLLPCLLVAATICLAATGVVFWLQPIPLGVPGEWTWSRIPFSLQTGITWSLSGISTAVYVLVVSKGDAVLSRDPTLRMQACWLALLFVLANGWWWMILQNNSAPYGYGRAPFVLYFPGSSGYFLQARDDAQNLRSFLTSYEDLLAEEDYLHIGTHPPGLTSGYRVLLEGCRRSDTLQSVLLSLEPTGMSDAMQEIRLSRFGNGQHLSTADEACLVGAALFVQLTFLIGVVALFILLRLDYPPSTAWRTAACWPLIPGAIVFFPKSDLLFPTIAVACCCGWFHGLRRQSAGLCLLAGVIAWVGMLLSLAIAPVLVIIALATLLIQPWRVTVAPAAPTSPPTAVDPRTLVMRRLLVPIGWGAVGFLVPTFALWLWSGLNLFAVWNWNLHNHALFYEHHLRTWWAWLLVNPIEFAFAIGLPIAAVAAFSWWQRIVSFCRTPTGALLLAWSLVMASLWLSGKNMGEAARLWLVFTPWPLMAAASAFDSGQSVSDQTARRRWIWLTLLAVQGICCLLTATRVDGFQFDQLLAG